MADEKSKPGSPAPATPFGDDTDWDSELAAWDAALPIGNKPGGKGLVAPLPRPAPAAPSPAPPPAPPPEVQAPPEADAVQFEMGEMASVELAVPKVLPDIFPPFSDDEAVTDPTAADHAVDLSEEMVIDEMPSSMPTASLACCTAVRASRSLRALRNS